MAHFRSTSEGYRQVAEVLEHSDSKTSLDQLFDMNLPQNAVPLRNRNLPNSFFQHPAPSLNVNHQQQQNSNGAVTNFSVHQRSTSFNQPPSAMLRNIRTHARTQSTLAPMTVTDTSNSNTNYSTSNTTQQNFRTSSATAVPIVGPTSSVSSARQNNTNLGSFHFRSTSFNQPPIAMTRTIRTQLQTPSSNLTLVSSTEQLAPLSSMEHIAPAMDQLAPIPVMDQQIHNHTYIQPPSLTQTSVDDVGSRHYCGLVYNSNQRPNIQTHSHIPSMEHIESEMSNSCFIYDHQPVLNEEQFYMNPQDDTYGHQSY